MARTELRTAAVRRTRWSLGIALLLGAVGAAGPWTTRPWGVVPAQAGDAELAKFLLKGGKDDLGKKLYDQAMTKFERAEREDGSLLEAVYCQALTLDRKLDARGAVQTYRRYLVAMEARAVKPTPSKDEAAFVKKARERIDALDAVSAEYRKLDEAFVEAVMGFARANVVKDPAIAAEALRTVLTVHPSHAEARRLLDRLPAAAKAVDAAKGADPARQPDPAPAADGEARRGFDAIKGWKDLLSSQHFAENEGWTFGSGLLGIDRQDGGVTKWRTGSKTGARYAVEIECRLVETYHKDGLVGLAFGIDGADLYTLFLTESAVLLHRTQGGQQADLTRIDLSPSGTGVWHRLGVIVRGKKVEIWVDGTKKADHDVAHRENLVGELGLFHQECKAELRLLRTGAAIP